MAASACNPTLPLLLHRRFSNESAMQVRDAATTMGLLFAGMGVGAFLGPLLFNPFTPSLWAHSAVCTVPFPSANMRKAAMLLDKLMAHAFSLQVPSHILC